jgi:hypothetical protein
MKRWVRGGGLGFKSDPSSARSLSPQTFRCTLIHSFSLFSPLVSANSSLLYPSNSRLWNPLRCPLSPTPNPRLHRALLHFFGAENFRGHTKFLLFQRHSECERHLDFEKFFCHFYFLFFGFVIFLFDISFPTLRISSSSFSLSLPSPPSSLGFGSY